MTESRNEAIAAEFRRIAADLERQQANPFRIRAYRRAAYAIAHLPEDVTAMARRGELVRIKGIGIELAKKIEHYCEHGTMESLADRPVAPEVKDWVLLPGLNASVVSYLYDRLQIKTLDALEALVRSRLLRTLPGVTATDEEILEGIHQLRAQVPP